MTTRGMTLLEVLAVLVLVALLASLVGPQLMDNVTWGERKAALVKCREMHDAVHIHRMKNPGQPPPRDLEAIPGLHLEPDPWGSPYRLETDGRKVRVWSRGPDRIEGTDDDICYVPRDEHP